MKTSYLFPNKYKKIGWLLFSPGVILGIFFFIFQEGMSDISFFNLKVFSIAYNLDSFFATKYFSITENNFIDEIIGILIITGGVLVTFSKQKTEDEFISKIRLESLVWASYINYAILLIAILFVFDMAFFWVLVFNMFTVLVFFIVRFNWVLSRSKKQLSDEE